jgi:prephenate dehydratase
MLKVGYLGPEGTFSEEASSLYSRRVKNAKFIPFTTIYDLLKAVDGGKIDEGITPIENSIEGTVGIVTDMLVGEVKLMIRQEIILPVFHYLLAGRGTKLSDVTDVISHPQAIDQCKGYLRKKLPRATFHLSYSTADAVRKVAMLSEGGILTPTKSSRKGRALFAAIGTKASAKLYGLDILSSKINDYGDNLTRFVVLSKKDHKRTGDDKTSLVFSISRDKPGGLHEMLGEFASRGINLTKIESRPSKRALGDYFFFVDLQGHRDDSLIKKALQLMKGRAAFFKMLGSYPRAKS